MMEWEHHCKEMPEEIDSICKLDFSNTSAMSFEEYRKGVLSTSFVLYGLKYCPYCGVKLGDTNEANSI